MARRQSGTVQLYHGPIVILLSLEVVILGENTRSLVRGLTILNASLVTSEVY